MGEKAVNSDSDLVARLRACLAEYDGRAITILGEAEANFGAEAGYLDALIALVADGGAHVPGGATWLLKSALESGRVLSTDQVAMLCNKLPDVTAWDAQLQICQSVQHIQVPGDHASQMAAWLDPLLGHKRPFLRAWSLDALYRLAQQHPDYEGAFAKALADADQDDAASVRARARNLV